MKRITLLSISLLLGFSTSLLGQNEIDALRHSQTSLNGTARSLGTGGAFSAVGADLSAASTNPAGLGLYRSSNFSISPGFISINNESQYLDSSLKANTNHFGIGNWGLVFNNKNYYDNGRVKEEIEQGLISYTFSFGQNQLENYKRTVNATGFNPYSSVSEKWAREANGFLPEELLFDSNEELAYQAFILNPVENRDGRTYYPAITDGQVQQTVEMFEEGRRNEWFAALAGNFNNKIFVGGAVGIQSLRYEQTLNYQEEDINNLYEFYDPDPDNGFPLEYPTNEIKLVETFSTRGIGINAKLGVIIKASDAFRVGISAQSPTFFNLTDQFRPTITHNFETDAGSDEVVAQPEQSFRYTYNLTTPFKLTAGLMYLIKKSGFITADVEMVDYSTSKLSSAEDFNSPNYYGFTPENNNINTLYQQAINVRVGGEMRFDIFRIRAGGALYGSPLSNEAAEYLDFEDLQTINQIAAERKMFTLGAGIRQPNYYLDVTFINQQQEDKFSPYKYDADDFFSPTVVNKRVSRHLVATVGFNF